MKMEPVKSNTIAKVGYENGTLRVVFKNDEAFDYSVVPAFLYGDLISSDCIGEYYRKNIQGKFNEKRIFFF